MSDDTEFNIFRQQADPVDAQIGRFDQMRKSMHDFIDDFPGLNDRQKAERKAIYDLQHDSNFAASGLARPAAKTPAELADERIAARFAVSPIGENLSATLAQEVERIAGIPHEHADMRRELIRHYGSDARYQQVIAEAKAALGSTTEFTPAMALSRHFLDVTSVAGRAVLAHEAALSARRAGR